MTKRVVCDFCGRLRLKTEMIEHQGHHFCDETELENLQLRNAAHSRVIGGSYVRMAEKGS